MALLAAYSFDEAGALVVDYSGKDNDFSLTGTSVQRSSTGHTNGGLTTTGSTPAVLPDIGRTPNRTIMLWEKGLGGVATDHWPIIFNVVALDSGAWGILRLSGNIIIQARNASTLARASIAAPADSNWHHVVGTYDGSTIRLYLDSVPVASTALTGPLRTDTEAPKLLGISESYYIDDLRIYDETLSPEQIVTAMTTPAGMPDGFFDFF
jgi:hypothetical protein